MPIPFYCAACGDVIGVEPEPMTYSRLKLGRWKDNFLKVSCKGKGQHPQPVRNRYEKCFGWIIRHDHFYPETKSELKWMEYKGPRNTCILRAMIYLFGEKTRGGKEKCCAYNTRSIRLKGGFFGELSGEGLAELNKK